MNNGMKTIMATILVATVIAGALFMSGCVGPTEEEVTKVTVMMSYVPVMSFSAFYCALDQGYYADEGLDVTIQHSAEGSMGPIKQVGANKIEFGCAAGNSLITARSKGSPVVCVYQIEQVNPYLVIALKSSGISEPEDLVGKDIAIPGTGCPQQSETEAILLKSGLDYNKLNFIPMAGQEMSVLLQNKTDAMAGHIIHTSLLKSMGRDKDINVIYGRDYANMVGIGVLTNEKTLEKNPELVQKFVRATDKGFKFAINNPDKAADIYIKTWAPQYADKKDFHLSFWKEMINECYQPDKYPPGQMREEQWTLTYDTMYDLGIIENKMDVNKAYTERFISSVS